MSVSLLGNVVIAAIANGGVYAMMAMGLTFVYGITRVFNMAQGSFFLWGGYFAWLLTEGYFHLNYQLAFAVTIVIMSGFGLLYEKIFIYPLRRFAEWGWTAIIVTLGTALLLDNLALVIFGALGRRIPHLVEGLFTFGNFSIAKHDITVLLILVAVVISLTLFLGKTKDGMAMRGVAQDTIGGRIVGIPANRVFSNAFAISAALAGIAGMLLAPRTQIYPYVGWPVLCKAFVVVVFGGLGSIKGTLIAAFTLAIIEAFVTYQIGGRWALAIFLLVLVVVLVIRPRGLCGKW